MECIRQTDSPRHVQRRFHSVGAGFRPLPPQRSRRSSGSLSDCGPRLSRANRAAEEPGKLCWMGPQSGEKTARAPAKPVPTFQRALLTREMRRLKGGSDHLYSGARYGRNQVRMARRAASKCPAVKGAPEPRCDLAACRSQVVPWQKICHGPDWTVSSASSSRSTSPATCCCSPGQAPTTITPTSCTPIPRSCWRRKSPSTSPSRCTCISPSPRPRKTTTPAARSATPRKRRRSTRASSASSPSP